MTETDPPESPASDEPEDVRERIRKESGMISWSELARHFARGVVLTVDVSLDLVDVAICLSTDDKGTLQQWLNDCSVSRANDDHARDWVAREPDFLCVVTAPWVLVQERPGNNVIH